MYIHIGYTLSPKKEVGVGEEESSGIGEVEVVVREMYTKQKKWKRDYIR